MCWEQKINPEKHSGKMPKCFLELKNYPARPCACKKIPVSEHIPENTAHHYNLLLHKTRFRIRDFPIRTPATGHSHSYKRPGWNADSCIHESSAHPLAVQSSGKIQYEKRIAGKGNLLFLTLCVDLCRHDKIAQGQTACRVCVIPDFDKLPLFHRDVRDMPFLC